MAMVLKTIVAVTSPWVRIPRPPQMTTENGPDLGECPAMSSAALVTDRSQMPLFVAGRGIYAGWILKRFPRSACGKQKGLAENEALAS